jgi:valyl-tRNA synthetase
MSKSKGNVVEPQVMIDKYSADALRFWAASSSLGEDLPFQEKELLTGQKMSTKLWNASKFSLMHLEDFNINNIPNFKDLEIIDKWLLSRLQKIIKTVTLALDKYEYARTKLDVEKFFWQDLCDNYLEIAKDRLYNPDQRGDKQRLSAQFALYYSLNTVLKLLAPIMPFITEEIYHLYFSDKEQQTSIHLTSWPEVDENMIDLDAEKAGNLLISVLQDVRKAKSEANKSLKEPISELIIEGKITPDIFSLIEDDLKASSRAEKVFYKELSKNSEADYLCDIKF